MRHQSMLLLLCITAFRVTSFSLHLPCKVKNGSRSNCVMSVNHISPKDDINSISKKTPALSFVSIGAAVATLLFPMRQAMAVDGQFGILEGKTVALLHPAIMLALFAVTFYSGKLGLQIRELREVNEKLKTISDKEGVEYNELVTTRKTLVATNAKEKHFNTGSSLLAVGIITSLFGAINTYMGAGELFPGAHLYIGAVITGLWAVAAALVPAMQKGNDAARLGHIGINGVIVLLFASQMFSGFEIVALVWKDVPWP